MHARESTSIHFLQRLISASGTAASWLLAALDLSDFHRAHNNDDDDDDDDVRTLNAA